jgi:hypothetical protein
MKALAVSVAGLAILILALPGRAQEKPAAEENAKGNVEVQRVDIFNGPVRMVHFYAKGMTGREKAALEDLQEAENDLARARLHREMPQSSASDGRSVVMNAVYPIVPPLYYGDLLPNYLSNLNYALSDSQPIYPWALGYPSALAALPYTGWGYYGFPNRVAYLGGYYGAYAPLQVAVTPQILNFGSSEGTRPAADERASSKESTEMSVAQARKRRDAALARASRLDRLRTALNLPKPEVMPAAEERENVAKVTVTMKNGATHKGRLVEETKDQLTLETDRGEIQIRRSEVASVTKEKPKKNR